MSVSNDIYEDLDEFALNLKLNTINTEKDELVKENTELKEKVETLSQEIKKLKQENERLKKNISSLFVTSKYISTKKHKKITSLQAEIENLKFRRRNTQDQQLSKRRFEVEDNENFNAKRVKRDPNFREQSNAEVEEVENEYCEKSTQNNAENTSQSFKENIQYQNKFKACKLNDDDIINPENDNNSVQQRNIEEKTSKFENIYQRRARENQKLFLAENKHKISSNENSCDKNEHHFTTKEVVHKELPLENNSNQNNNLQQRNIEQKTSKFENIYERRARENQKLFLTENNHKISSNENSCDSNEHHFIDKEIVHKEFSLQDNSNKNKNEFDQELNKDEQFYSENYSEESSRCKNFRQSDRRHSPKLRNERYPKHRNSYNNHDPRSKSRNHYYEEDNDSNDYLENHDQKRHRNYKDNYPESRYPYDEKYRNFRFNRRGRNPRMNYHDDYEYPRKGPRTPSPENEKETLYRNENKHWKFRNENTIETYGDYKRSKKHKQEFEDGIDVNRRSRIDQNDDFIKSKSYRSRSKSAHQQEFEDGIEFNRRSHIDQNDDFSKSKSYRSRSKSAHKQEFDDAMEFNRRSRIDQDDDSSKSKSYRSRSKSAHSRSKTSRSKTPSDSHNDRLKNRSRSGSRFEFDKSADQYDDSSKPNTSRSRSKSINSRSKRSRSKTPGKTTSESLADRLKRSRSRSRSEFDNNTENREVGQYDFHQSEFLEYENINKKKLETRKIDLDSYRKRKNEIHNEIENCTPKSIEDSNIDKNIETYFEVNHQSEIESNSQNNKKSTQNSSSSEYNFGKNSIVNELASSLTTQNVLKERDIMKIIYDDEDFVEIIGSVKNSIAETASPNESPNEKQDIVANDFDTEKSLSNENQSERKLEEKNNKELNERSQHQSELIGEDNDSTTNDKNDTNYPLSLSHLEKVQKISSVSLPSEETALTSDCFENKKNLEESHSKNTDTLKNKMSSEININEVANIPKKSQIISEIIDETIVNVEETTNIKENNQPMLEIINLDVDTEDEIFINDLSGSVSKEPLNISTEQEKKEVNSINNKVDYSLENIMDEINYKMIDNKSTFNEKENGEKFENEPNEKTTVNVKQNKVKIIRRKYRKSPRKSIENITDKLRNKEKLNDIENNLEENKTNNNRSDDTKNESISTKNKLPENITVENRMSNNPEISEDIVSTQESNINENMGSSSTLLPNTKESDQNIENKMVSPIKDDLENFMSMLFQASPVKQSGTESASKSAENITENSLPEILSEVSENKFQDKKKASSSKQTSNVKKNISKKIDKGKHKSLSKNKKVLEKLIKTKDVQEKEMSSDREEIVSSNSNKNTLKRSSVPDKNVQRNSTSKTKETQEQKLPSHSSRGRSKSLSLKTNTEFVREENNSLDKDKQVLENASALIKEKEEKIPPNSVEMTDICHQETNVNSDKISQISEVTRINVENKSSNPKNRVRSIKERRKSSIRDKQVLENETALTKEKIPSTSVAKPNSVEMKQICSPETNVPSNRTSQTSEETNLKGNAEETTTESIAEKNKSSIKDKQVLENANALTKEKISSVSIDPLNSTEMKDICYQESSEVTSLKENIVERTRTESISEKNKSSIKDKQVLENVNALTKEKQEEKISSISMDSLNSSEMIEICCGETNVSSDKMSQSSEIISSKENAKTTIKKPLSNSIETLSSTKRSETCRQETNVPEITSARGNVETTVEVNQASLKIPADDEFTFLIDASISVMNEPVSNNSQHRRKSFDENVEILKNNLISELEKVGSTSNNTCGSNQSTSSINSDVNNSNSVNDSENVNKNPKSNSANHELVPLKNKHSVYSREVINENKIRIVVKRNRRR